MTARTTNISSITSYEVSFLQNVAVDKMHVGLNNQFQGELQTSVFFSDPSSPTASNVKANNNDLVRDIRNAIADELVIPSAIHTDTSHHGHI
mmetsp:Transcript_18563/g.50738  ORF Transcript_18563/g.50738 Transcript_18563/m.50738 type:complete len:92 (+) Transcript_18563:162-437(+)